MLFKAGKSTSDQHREMIYGLLKQNDALKVTLGKMSRSIIDLLEANTPDEFVVKRAGLKQVLAEIAKAGGE